MAKREPKFKVGDEVLLYEPHYHHYQGSETLTRTTVVKVGTKHAYVSGSWQVEKTPFDKFTGHEVNHRYSGYNKRIWVPAEYEAREHRAAVLKELKEAYDIRIGREYSRNGDERYSTEALEKILAVAKEVG